MRLLLLTALAMVAFAANSVLNRAAVAGGMDPVSFAVVRTVTGAGMLGALALVRRGDAPGRGSWGGAASLALYLGGFSLAYLALDAGTGALILFGGVQVVMFAAALGREAVPPRRWIGAGIALAGLVVLLLPGGGGAPDPLGALAMGAAALGWGIYSLLGRAARDPLGQSAGNFLCAVPLVLPLLLIAPDLRAPQAGLILAALSGAVTSGLGYALWYAVVPRLGASRAAVAQLCVPVIAAAGGAALLGEAPDARFAAAAALTLGGIALSLAPLRGTGTPPRA
ncbi:EamA family transporter [Wenxinia saemankumensis]|uniref:EamA-like transporter family protein n=1 Tax=Wenxinia saemankumensis TaxID=1447782 RepID=A0A1M6BVJ5_9RHOB|nr:EamA family transporter [Wenxinia saemankumensis]SHI52812.1 EamA-like transporter family protein [Wenxinia saemankumensis]